ncbi:MAG: 50S ribosomal protein L23 [Candidatus Omnitrophota bacterium]|jgi:large subunit ribosomal protein L23|nr:50S ribosomal protein L23 [Candidatus Omnitrophota bacterium]
MITCYDVVKTIIRTEKATMLEPRGKYLFHVAVSANKIMIKKSVEEIYNVKVKSVHTQMMPGKSKRVRQEMGYTSDWKKAVVTLIEGQKIEVA